MKKLLLLSIAILAACTAMAQTTTHTWGKVTFELPTKVEIIRNNATNLMASDQNMSYMYVEMNVSAFAATEAAARKCCQDAIEGMEGNAKGKPAVYKNGSLVVVSISAIDNFDFPIEATSIYDEKSNIRIFIVTRSSDQTAVNTFLKSFKIA